jgi:hypothetical protein
MPLTYNGQPLGDAPFEAPQDAFLPPPQVRPVAKQPGLKDLLGMYGGMVAPDALTTEANMRMGDRDMNPLMPKNTAGRAAYFGGEVMTFALLDKLLTKINPKLGGLLRAYVAGQRGGLIDNNIRAHNKYKDMMHRPDVPPVDHRR